MQSLLPQSKKRNIVKAYTNEEMFNFSFNAADEEMALTAAETGTPHIEGTVNTSSETTGESSTENIKGQPCPNNGSTRSPFKKNQDKLTFS
ncbi:hypothetical protein ACH5RR_029180 [Cinchona calisaya]|uniref:Uncharacterized protein n=1 Tax=Cinchona calisaya TaxID=153742 RepID=A0ABD2YVC3_9GENT